MFTAAGTHILRGQVLAFKDDPFLTDPDQAVDFNADGAVVVEAGKIKRVGNASAILRDAPQLPVHHYPDDLIMAGFVDCHVHYPQAEVIASYGEELLEWLHRYTFPAELKFADTTYARRVAEQFLDDCLRNGTTTASVYATTHPQSVAEFFAAAEARDMCMATGKVMMDRNAPAGLLDTPQTAYDQSKALLDTWHGRGRMTYVITPRFVVTSTAEQLVAAATLWREHPTALMQTHIDENRNEIELARSLYPEASDYLNIYEQFGLIGSGSNFGHAIHLTDREKAAFAATGSGISHCPTSNLFLGSGLMDLHGLRDGRRDIPVGLATDIGGGSSMSMLQTMRAAYEVARLCGYNLHPAKAFYLATLGSAQTMRLDTRIGNVRAGYDADLIVLDLNSTPAIKQRMRHANDHWEALFIQMIMADDRAVRATYVHGRKAYERDDTAYASLQSQ